MEAGKKLFLDYIDKRIDLLSTNTQQEVKIFKSLLTFFQGLRKEINSFTKSFLKSVLNLKEGLIVGSELGEYVQALFNQHIDVTNALDGYKANLDSNVIVPLESFLMKYEQLNEKIVVKANKIVAKINEQKQKLKKLKTRYHKDSKVAMNCNSEESYKNKSSVADESKKEYLRFVNFLNKNLDDSKQKYEKILKAWYSSEERKLNNVKDILIKFHEASTSISNTCFNFLLKSKSAAEAVSSEMNIEKYIPKPNSIKEKLFDKVFFELAPTDKSSNEEKVQELISTGITEEDLEFAKESFKALIDDRSISKLEFDKLLNIIKTREGEKAICKVLSRISSRVEIDNLEVYNYLLVLAETLVNQVSLNKFPEAKYLSSILNLGAYISHNSKVSEKYVQHIRDKISNNGLWRNKEIWNKTINYRIAKSLKQSQAYNENAMDPKELVKEGKKSDAKEKKKSEQEEIGKRNTIFNEFLFISSEMAFYSINPGTSRELIVAMAKEWDVETKRLYQILSNFELAQTIPRDEDPSSREILRYSLEKREKERKRYSHSKATMIIGLSLKFVNDINTLSRILMLSKKFYTLFKTKIYYIVLLTSTEKIRFWLWKNILFSKGFPLLYEKLKDTQMKTFIESNLEIDRVISLDVMRSFSLYSDTDKEAIKSVLRCYALTNPEVEYCQGMNSIAGMLYMIYKDEAIAFTMLSTLIDEFGLSNLFKDNVPLLRTCFYDLNRLIALFLPKLHLHFLGEGVTVDYFATSWFMTVFTCVMEYSKTLEVPRLLLLIFDGFLTKGIRSLLKSTLFILGYHENELLKLNSEEIAKLLTKLPMTDFFSSTEIEKTYLKEIGRYNVTQKLLEKLDDEHNNIRSISKEYRISTKLPRLPFKHYIKYNYKVIPVYLSY